MIRHVDLRHLGLPPWMDPADAAPAWFYLEDEDRTGIDWPAIRAYARRIGFPQGTRRRWAHRIPA